MFDEGRHSLLASPRTARHFLLALNNVTLTNRPKSIASDFITWCLCHTQYSTFYFELPKNIGNGDRLYHMKYSYCLEVGSGVVFRFIYNEMVSTTVIQSCNVCSFYTHLQ